MFYTTNTIYCNILQLQYNILVKIYCNILFTNLFLRGLETKTGGHNDIIITIDNVHAQVRKLWLLKPLQRPGWNSKTTFIHDYFTNNDSCTLFLIFPGKCQIYS